MARPAYRPRTVSEFNRFTQYTVHVEVHPESTHPHPPMEGTPVATASARNRVVIDMPADPGTASPRTMAALAEELAQYGQVVLVKDREITLTDFAEVVNVHVHTSTEDLACEDCVKLAEDERS